MLLIPPRLQTTRVSPGAPNTVAWKAGASGAPWPPAATSRLRKSAITSTWVSSASSAGLLICRV